MGWREVEGIGKDWIKKGDRGDKIEGVQVHSYTSLECISRDQVVSCLLASLESTAENDLRIFSKCLIGGQCLIGNGVFEPKGAGNSVSDSNMRQTENGYFFIYQLHNDMFSVQSGIWLKLWVYSRRLQLLCMNVILFFLVKIQYQPNIFVSIRV